MANLDRVAEVGPAGVGARADRKGEVRDAELRHQWGAGAGDRELTLGAVDGRGVVEVVEEEPRSPPLGVGCGGLDQLDRRRRSAGDQRDVPTLTVITLVRGSTLTTRIVVPVSGTSTPYHSGS